MESVVTSPVLGELAEGLRSLRRWVALLGVLSLAALAVAVYALMRADEVDGDAADNARVATLEDRLDTVQRQLANVSSTTELRQIQSRIAGQADHLRRLDRQLDTTRDDVKDAEKPDEDTTKQLTDLDKRIDTLVADVEELKKQDTATTDDE